MNSDDLEQQLRRLGEAVAPKQPLVDGVLRRITPAPTAGRTGSKPVLRHRRQIAVLAGIGLATAAGLALVVIRSGWLVPPPESRPAAVAQRPGTSSPPTPIPTERPPMSVFFDLTPVAFHKAKWGFIDKTGKVVIEPRFAQLENFSEGLAAARIERAGKWGYIDRTGRVVIEPQFDLGGQFHEGFAAVKVGEKWGYIDRTGRLVVEPQFAWADRFSEGLAAVKPASERPGTEKYGYIDTKGKIVIAAQYPNYGRFADGLAAVAFPAEADKPSRYGYIDRTGQVVIPPQFEYASSFSEGRALYKQGPKWGYLDRKGQVVIPAQYDSAGLFVDGRARVVLRNERLFPELKRVFRIELVGYVNPAGEVVVPFKQPYDYGLIYVADKDAVWACYDNITDGSGRTMLDPQVDWDRVHFEDGMAKVRTDTDNEAKHGFVDRTGRLVIKPQFEWAEHFHDGLARFAVDLDWEAFRKAMERNRPRP